MHAMFMSLGQSPASLSAPFANVGPGNSPQSNADVTITFAGGVRKFRATLSGGTYGAGGRTVQLYVNSVLIDSDSAADGTVVEADIASSDLVHLAGTKGGTTGTSWNATVALSLNGQSLGSITASVTAP